MLTTNKILMTAVDVSADVAGPAYYLKNVFGIAIQAVFAGSPVGTVHLEGSCDEGNKDADEPTTAAGVVNWNLIDDSTATVSGAGVVTWNYNGVFYKWIRVVYDATSGTGSVTVTVNTKGS